MTQHEGDASLSEMTKADLGAMLLIALDEYYTEQAKMLLLTEQQTAAISAIEAARVHLSDLDAAITRQSQALRLVVERTAPIYRRLTALRADELRQAA